MVNLFRINKYVKLSVRIPIINILATQVLFIYTKTFVIYVTFYKHSSYANQDLTSDVRGNDNGTYTPHTLVIFAATFS